MFFRGILHDRATNQSTPVAIRLQPGVLVMQPDFGPSIQWLQADLQSGRKTDDGLVILQSGRQFLEVEEPGFMEDLERIFPKNHLFRTSVLDKIGVAGCLLSLALVLVPLLAAYFWLIPFLADRAAKHVSPETEKQVGDSWYQSLTATYKIDTAKTRLVQQFYDSLHYNSNYQMRITVVQEPVVNAFALPGGRIVVFDRIIEIMDAPEQLAALLGHESSHIQLRHSTRAIFRQLANNLFFSFFLGDYGDISGIIARHGDELAGLSYSRGLELEADDNGLKLMQQSQIPVKGMRDLFRKMQSNLEEAGQGSDAPNFLSTHPSMGERIKIVEEKIAATGGGAESVAPALKQIWEAIRQ